MPSIVHTEGLPLNPEAVLNKAVLRERIKRPKVDFSLPFNVFASDKIIQLWVNSPACRFSLTGKCTICDYWDGDCSEQSIAQACTYIENECGYYDTLILNTCGSCLCEQELSCQNLYKILCSITKTSIRHVILETHLMYASVEKLRKIKSILGDIEVSIEYGQESTSQYVLEYCLNKPSMLCDKVINIKKLQSIGVRLIANVILGAPFLTVRQRIKDAENSIRDLLSSGVDSVVLFPVNIKPFTLVKYLFDNGFYKRVNAIEILKVLSKFTADQLTRIELVWFEPSRVRQDAYQETGMSPRYCKKCGLMLLHHLFLYKGETNGAKRKAIINKAIQRLCPCACSLYDYKYPSIKKAYAFLQNGLAGTSSTIGMAP